MNDINLPVILLAAFLASSSPGPATLMIAGTAMSAGRGRALALASGVLTGSVSWSLLAALGFSALMYSNAWIASATRYLAAAYLLFLAWKSARAAWRGARVTVDGRPPMSMRTAYLRGLMLHLTNPKPMLFFGSLFAIGVPPSAPLSAFVIVIASIALLNTFVFLGYAILFSSPPLARGYARLKRWFEAAFALLFGAAAIKILTTR